MKTIIETKQREGLKTLEYRHESASKLMFLQHGIHSNKENPMHMLGVMFVRLGYHVVAIDAAKHGSRGAFPFDPIDEDQAALMAPQVIKETAEDLKRLYENSFKDTYTSFDITGISMGGMVAHYLSRITKAIDTLISLISTPDFYQVALDLFPQSKREMHEDQAKETEMLIHTMNPAKHAESMHFNRMIMMNGTKDPLIDYKQSEAYALEHPERTIIFKTFPSEHAITPTMQEALEALLED